MINKQMFSFLNFIFSSIHVTMYNKNYKYSFGFWTQTNNNLKFNTRFSSLGSCFSIKVTKMLKKVFFQYLSFSSLNLSTLRVLIFLHFIIHFSHKWASHFSHRYGLVICLTYFIADKKLQSRFEQVCVPLAVLFFK